MKNPLKLEVETTPMGHLRDTVVVNTLIDRQIQVKVLGLVEGFIWMITVMIGSRS